MSKHPQSVGWAPLPDITVDELARALPIVIALSVPPYPAHAVDLINVLPEDVRRHFDVLT